MSIGPLGGLAGGAAGSPLAQTTGSDVERARQEATSQQTRDTSNQKAETASGIGETDGEDHETAERDADGRRIWEKQKKRSPDAGAEAPEQEPPRPKDPTGHSGNLLDLTA